MTNPHTQRERHTVTHTHTHTHSRNMSGVNLAVGQCSQEGSQGSVSVSDPWSVSQSQVLESGQTVETRETRAADGGTTTQLQLQEGAPDVSQVNEAFVTKILAVGKVQMIHSLETNWGWEEKNFIIKEQCYLSMWGQNYSSRCLQHICAHYTLPE